jgi:nucleoid-associated protein YgaU
MLDFHYPMSRPAAVFLFSLISLGLVAISSVGSASDVSYPRYEPPNLEDLPVAVPAPTQAGNSVTGEAAPEPAPQHPSAAEPAPVAPSTADVVEPAPAAEPPTPVQEEAPPPPTPKPRPFKTYKVWIWQENGDTLWRIAQKVYGDKDKWPLIYKANRNIIKDPNKIYPKQKLRIPPPDWQP